jgi:hypothetical protein
VYQRIVELAIERDGLMSRAEKDYLQLHLPAFGPGAAEATAAR